MSEILHAVGNRPKYDPENSYGIPVPATFFRPSGWLLGGFHTGMSHQFSADMKRFTETQKWADPWFRRLSPSAKLLWAWIVDNCDGAGVIDLDLELASFQIGLAMGMDTLSELGERVLKLPCGKHHIPKFIPFQYGTLSDECKAHRPVFASIEKHRLNGYPKGIDTLQEKEKVTVKEKATEKEGARFEKPTIEQVKLCCAKTGLSDSDAEWFWNKGESGGWMNGGKRIVSWPHTVAAWKAQGYFPSQKQHQQNGAARTPMNIKAIIQAKETLAMQIKKKHSSETAMSTVWNDDAKRQEFFTLRKEIKELNTELSAMA